MDHWLVGHLLEERWLVERWLVGHRLEGHQLEERRLVERRLVGHRLEQHRLVDQGGGIQDLKPSDTSQSSLLYKDLLCRNCIQTGSP